METIVDLGLQGGAVVGFVRLNNEEVRWNDLRDRLRELRVDTFPNQSEFALASELSRKTIWRMENIKADPTYKPDYDTIAKWLRACADPTSPADFIVQFEANVTSPVHLVGDTLSEPQLGRVAPHGTAADARLLFDTLDDAALLERIAFILLRARAALQRDERLRSAHADESASSGGSPTASGDAPPNLQIVK